MLIKQKSCAFRLIKQNFHYTTMATNYFSQPPLREQLCKAKTTALLQHLCTCNNCILLNSRLVNLYIKRKKDVSFRFGTYYFAKERSSQRSDRRRRLGREQEPCSKDFSVFNKTFTPVQSVSFSFLPQMSFFRSYAHPVCK